jgi:ribose 5-phosphate isomerase A
MNDEHKRAAARAALDELPPKGIIGLGTGSTVRFFVEAIGERVAAGHAYIGVPTSKATEEQARSLGIPLLDDAGPWEIEVTVDGADEVDERLDLIKGGGGAHTREKIVAAASRRLVIIVDESKLSPKLGTKFKLPIEVLPFGHAQTARRLEAFGPATLRLRDGAPLRTDAGNLVYDIAIGPRDDAAALDAAIRAVPGVVETGFFVGRADVVVVAAAEGVRRLRR